MTRPVQGLPGGAQEDSITTSPIAVDLSAFRGRTVLIWSDDVSLWLGWAASAASPTLTVSGDSAASTTSTKADRVRQGKKLPRLVDNRYPFLIAQAVSGSGTLHVKLASDADGADMSDEESSGVAVTASISGTVSTIQGAPAKTDSTTYITTGNMSADIDGAAITVGPEGRLLLQLAWSNTGSPIGTFVLQGLMPDGSAYDDIPLSSAAFLRHPNSDTNTSVAYFTDLQVFTSVRFKYRRTSGGTANTTLDVNTRVM